MRNYKILFFSALLFLIACASEEEIPSDIIPPERMTQLLVEVHLMDGVGYSLNQAPDSLYKQTMGTYVEIFNRYRTDSAAFRKSYTWYTKHPVELDKIYDNVLVKMQKKSDSLSKKRPKLPNAIPAK